MASSPAAVDQREASGSSLQRAARGTVWNVLGAVVTTITGFGSVFLVSNRLGTVATGVVFAAAGLFTLLANAAKIGTESSLTWYVSQARAAGPADVRAVVRSAYLVVGVLSGAIGVALIAAAPWLAERLTDADAAVGDLRRMLVVFGFALPAMSLTQAAYGVSRGFGTMRPSVIQGQILRPGLMFASLAVLVFVTDDLWLLALSWLLGNLVAFVLSVVWVRRRLARTPVTGLDERDRFWAFSRPRALTDIVHSALDRLDVVLVGALAGSIAAGEYVAANRLVLAGQLLGIAIAQAVAPHVSAHLAAEEYDEAQRLVRTITTWNVVVLWPLLAVLALGAPGVVTLFGEGFAGSADLVVILSVAMALVASLGPGDTVLLMTGDSRGSLVNHLLSLATMLIVAVVLIPQVGALGAAWSWASSRLVLRALSVWRIQKATGVRCVGADVVLAAFVVVATYVPAAVAARFLLDDPAQRAVFLAVVGTAAFAAAAWSVRGRLALADLLRSFVRR